VWNVTILRTEVALEFERMIYRGYARCWEAVEEKLHERRLRALARWSDSGKWWARSYGKKYQRAYARERAALLKKVIVATRHCQVCGKLFEVTAYRERRARDRVCSNRCKGASRKNIARYTVDGQTHTLTEWSAIRGIKLATLWKRVHTGWTLEQALAKGKP